MYIYGHTFLPEKYNNELMRRFVIYRDNPRVHTSVSSKELTTIHKGKSKEHVEGDNKIIPYMVGSLNLCLFPSVNLGIVNLMCIITHICHSIFLGDNTQLTRLKFSRTEFIR